MRLMTFNILYGTARTPAGGWPARRKLVADVIGRWDPDAAGLQEAMADQLSDLSADLPEYSIIAGPMSGPNRLRGLAGTVSPALGAARLFLLRRLQKSFGAQGRTLSGAQLLGAAGPAGTLASRRVTGRRLMSRSSVVG